MWIAIFAIVASCISLTSAGSVASSAGDPYIRTLDGEIIEFQGRCFYVFCQTKEQQSLNGAPAFIVIIANRQATASPVRSYTYLVDLQVEQHRFMLNAKKGVLMVDDYRNVIQVIKEKPLTYTFANVNITISAKGNGPLAIRSVVVGPLNDPHFALTFQGDREDGRHIFMLHVNDDRYRGKLEGLAGDWDGNKANDITIKGQTQPTTDTAAFGNSFLHGNCDETETKLT